MKADKWIDRWKGRTVVCIASGPSLTAEDCEKVRASGHPTIVTNTTVQLCPWADVLFAFDSAWLRMYRKEVDEFKGAVLTWSKVGKNFGAESLADQGWYRNYGNSGTSAISLAISCGAKRIILLGYDCQRTGGKVHWHGDHPKGLGNAASLDKWPRQFASVAKYAAERGVTVENCSRATALTCFARKALEEAL